MADITVPIGQVKRDISELVNRVAYKGERIILTSRDKPKAALVSIEDYQRLTQEREDDKVAQWQTWLTQTNALAETVLARRGGVFIPVDDLLSEDREDLERRND
ncbi:MAG TPA: type II toxin-antitoxin system Phd/YefM family antitoxin [Anaerolineae bacterium]|nr:type II toxin-antitoxin system Phd/YefM family antitoxin [Anaerolineae bacterium]HQK14725.1 type II toxin-antitoxin system Phd/YefM family antitoxin [Anaerolineae bacterium]